MSKKKQNRNKKKSGSKKTAKKHSKRPTKKLAAKKSSSTTSKKVKRPATLIQSPKTTHIFDNALYGYDTFLGLSEINHRHDCIDNCEQVDDFLKNQSLLPQWMRQVESFPVYRVVDKARDPLDSKVTLGAGGRVNLGMAQCIPEFKHLRALGGVYASLEFETAKAEYESGGLPVGPNQYCYKLTTEKTQLRVLDFDMVVTHIDGQLGNLPLSSLVSNAPTMGAWVYQKYPLVSQIIGTWLLGTIDNIDALLFSSTKRPSGQNCFLTNSEDWNSEKL